MSRLQAFPALPALLLALAWLLPAPARAAAKPALEEFYPLAHGASQGRRDFSGWTVACTASARGESGLLSLLADRTGHIVLAAYSAERPEAVAALFDPRKKGASRNWALLFDRAGAGRVDYLAFYLGTQPVKPRNFRADFPKGRGITRREDMDYLFDHVAMVFYHAADEDGDGRADAAVYPVTDPERPAWVDGFAVLKGEGGQTVAGDYFFRGDIGAPLGPVPRNAQGLRIRLNPEEGMAPDAILPGWSRILGEINGAVRECGLGNRLLSRP